MLKILLVDDHKVIMDGLRVLLPSLIECKIVATANNGEEAVEAAEVREVDLILIDLKMPGKLNGAQATKRIKSKNPDIKIIALSMMDDASSVHAMMRAGADGYLVKNVASADMKSAIDLVMKNNIYIHRELRQYFLNSFSAGEMKKRFLITEREEEVLNLLVSGMTNKEIAKHIFRSEETIRSHRKNIMEKFGCRNTAELVSYAITHHLVSV